MIRTILLLAAGLLCLSGVSSGGVVSSFTPLHGHWQGEGKIIVTWCRQDSLRIDIWIHKDGRVTGRVGDAILRNGRIRYNSDLLRKLGNPTFVISGRLQGDLVAREQIHRSAIKLLVDYRQGALVGDFRSSGSKFGGKGSMMLAGTDLLLVRLPGDEGENGR